MEEPSDVTASPTEQVNTIEIEHEDGSVTITVQDQPAQSANRNTLPWLTKIYISHTLSTWGDRSWEFFVPLAMAEIFPFTLLPVSLILFVENIMGALFVSFMGTMVDKTSRTFMVKFSLFAQNALLVLSSLIISALWWLYYDTGAICGSGADAVDCIPMWSDPQFIVLFSLLCLGNSFSMLFSMASSIAVERDWIVVLCGNDAYLLTKTNSVMQRIDLLCKVAAPAVLGFVLQATPLIWVVIGIAIWNIVTFFPELLLLLKIYADNEAILAKASNYSSLEGDSSNRETQIENEETEKKKENSQTTSHSILSQVVDVLRTTLNGWVVYFSHHVILASLSFVFLFCTVLASGGVFNAYLKIQGIEDWMLGTVTGIAAIIGLTATFVQPILANRWGAKITGVTMLWSQVTLLVIGVICLATEFTPYYLFLFMGSVALSRFPLWSFDLVERQIMQLSIAENERGIVNSVETSMTNVATLVIYTLATIFSDPDDFVLLAIFSISAVALSAVLFSAWSLYNRMKVQTSSEIVEIELQNLPKEEKHH